MPHIVIKMDDGAEGELKGDSLELTSMPMRGGHIIILGRIDFVEVYGQHVKNAPHVPETRAELQRALADNKQLGEQLSHVQGRCTDYLEENRALKRRVQELDDIIKAMEK